MGLSRYEHNAYQKTMRASWKLPAKEPPSNEVNSVERHVLKYKPHYLRVLQRLKIK